MTFKRATQGVPSYAPAFDLLATLIAVVRTDGVVVFVNAALEDVIGVSRRSIQGTSLADYFTEVQLWEDALQGAQTHAFDTLRYDARLRRPHQDALPVHVIVAPTEVEEEVLVELLPLEQQTRQEREERILDQAQAHKEQIRNLAHEIKNPLGGIRGAAQLLQTDVKSQELFDYTEVIIQEVDRLQTLVDRLLAPNRRTQVVSDVNIHEVCDLVRSLIVAEFPRGLRVIRDYDISIPELRGDRSQLIQTVLNIAHNAAQALVGRMAEGTAEIVLRTRIHRQATLAKQHYPLALELHVIDNGPGIPVSMQDKLFSPLVSGRDGGSGLGLNLAQTFVQQHQGLIECDSVSGRTDFKIVIPLPSDRLRD